MATTATSSIPNGSSPVRLLSDPNTVICPDFSTEAYKDLRKDLGPDDAGAMAKLSASWVKDNDQLKVQWAAQEDADKAVQEAEEVQRQLEAEKAAAEAEKIAEEERLEAEKKKPKLGDFDKRLEKLEYCPLYPFTPDGLKEAQIALLSSSDDILSISLGRNADNQFTVQTGLANTTHRNMVKDQDLSWHQFSLASMRYIKELIRAGWPETHVKAISQFFYAIESHSWRAQDHGEKVLMIYADRFHLEWFQTLGTPKAFNLSIINDALLSKISDEYFMKLHSDTLSR
ncbi:hypothetical protein DFH07DRAFT_763770 [Mycena maculata]|uniref:Uncharacterized protein n=1 Tax=Mycena maculata TaxID=230809 RepID=A0AAD7P2M4_9AGAR|nr:hypothetical protein DFH07DRAFT_763770 [Mycena maculata]